MEENLTLEDIMSTRRRVATRPIVTPNNPNAQYIPSNDCKEVGVIGALTSYNDSSLTPRDINPVLASFADGTTQAGPAAPLMPSRFGPNAQPPMLLDALEIASKTQDVLSTRRDNQEMEDLRSILKQEDRYSGHPDAAKYLPPVHKPDEHRQDIHAEEWKWKGPTSAKYQWRTDARRRAKDNFPETNAHFSVNPRMHNREFKGPMYIL